ncbi:MAG: hypothetical protein FJ286_18130 [Planctomycetes bacterium]|nr:hypothetical protein [Planctomycetota bacterium]
MDHNSKSDNDPLPRDNTSQPKKRIDINPPYGSESAHAVEGFRRLLAALIARQIVTERRGPPPGMVGE